MLTKELPDGNHHVERFRGSADGATKTHGPLWAPKRKATEFSLVKGQLNLFTCLVQKAKPLNIASEDISMDVMLSALHSTTTSK